MYFLDRKFWSVSKTKSNILEYLEALNFIKWPQNILCNLLVWKLGEIKTKAPRITTETDPSTKLMNIQLLNLFQISKFALKMSLMYQVYKMFILISVIFSVFGESHQYFILETIVQKVDDCSFDPKHKDFANVSKYLMSVDCSIAHIQQNKKK